MALSLTPEGYLPSRHPKRLLLRAGIDIVETVDGGWMVLQYGYQLGGRIDTSGAGNRVFSTWREAYAFGLDRAERTTTL